MMCEGHGGPDLGEPEWWQLHAAFLGKKIASENPKGFFLPLFAPPTAPKPFISPFELAPETSSVLGKACVHGSDPCFVPSLCEVSLSGKVTHAIAGKP